MSAIEERVAEELFGLLPLEAMRGYVPGAIWSKILAGDPEWIVNLSERRTVTLLLIRVCPPAAMPILALMSSDDMFCICAAAIALGGI